MPTPDAVKAALIPLCRTIAGLDLADPAAAKAALDRAHPIAALGEVIALLKAAQAEGWLTPRRATPTLTFGRLAKAGPETAELGIDVVHMSGRGAEHVHPRGEVDLCFVDGGGAPMFCGNPAGWTVLPPASRHVPEVTGGTMLIVYFLPGSAIEFV
jgi:hypothetical protein